MQLPSLDRFENTDRFSKVRVLCDPMRRNPAFAKDSYALADIFLAELEKDLAVWEGTRTWAGKVSTEKHDGG